MLSKRFSEKKGVKGGLLFLAILMLALLVAAFGAGNDNGSQSIDPAQTETTEPTDASDSTEQDQAEQDSAADDAEGGEEGYAPPTANVTLRGAGASFPHPLFMSMFYDYNQQYPNIIVDYESTGSGGGQRALKEGTVDFAASDAYMTEEDMAEVPNGGVIHIPITIGTVAIIYNLEGIDTGLKLTQETLSKIYLGEITRWNDPLLVADNPDLDLPDQAITVVHRSDSSGTTSIFTDYLSKVSPEWAEKVGSGTAVDWPTGIGGNKNDGVAAQVAQTPGSIGYVEFAFAVENNLTYAQLRNKDGYFVFPSLEAASLAAADAAANMPEDTRVSLVEKGGKDSYGIVGTSWLLLYKEYPDPDKKAAIQHLVSWMYREGQKHAEPLHYAPIPEEIAQINDRNLAKIK